jgi:hypothetical protein
MILKKVIESLIAEELWFKGSIYNTIEIQKYTLMLNIVVIY